MTKSNNKKGAMRAPPNKNAKKIAKMTRAISSGRNPTFGNVSTINTAPVAIGNSMRGLTARTVVTKDGMKVIGRDYCFTVASTGTVTNWILSGGCPLSPFSFASAVLQNCARMYARYKISSMTFHYITSSSTSQTGDVLFYLRKNEGQTMPQPTASTFLNYVLSDSNTVIGPQWTNHSATFDTRNTKWLSTDYGATSEIDTYNQYDFFLYSKTSAANSPGYLIVDYEYDFREISLNPRNGNISEVGGAKSMWTPASISVSGVKVGNTTPVQGVSDTAWAGGVTISNITTSLGDVFEFVLDVTNSLFSATNAGTFANQVYTNDTNLVTYKTLAFTLTDGMVFYLVDNGTNLTFYSNRDSAFGNGPAILCSISATYAEKIRGYVKIIGSVRPTDLTYNQ